MLNEERRKQLDGIVLKMSEQNAPQSDVQFVVDDFKKKYEIQAITHQQASQVAPKEPDTFGGKVAEFGKDVVRDITKPVVQSLAAPAQLAAFGIDKATGGNSPVEDFSFTMPFWGEISPAKTNQEAIGRGMKTAAAGAGPVSGGALYMGGQAMEENKSALSVGLNTAGGALGGKLGDLAFKGVGTVLSKSGKAMQTAGAGYDAIINSAKKNYEAVLGPTTKANKRITQQITGELAERQVTATTKQELWDKAAGQVEKYGEQIHEFYKALPENTKVKTDGILKAIDAAKRKLFVKGEGAYMVPEVNKALFKKYQDLQIEIMSMARNGNAPIEGVRALRQALDKNIAKTTSTFGITGEESIITEARKGVSNILRGELAKQFPDVAVINKEFTFWSRVQQVLGDTIERKTGQGTPLGEKIMTAAGGAAGLGSGGVGAGVSTAIAIKYLHILTKSAAWQTTSASLKMKLANALAEGDGIAFSNVVNGLLKASGYVIEKTGNILKATPGVLKEGPRKAIPGTREINLKGKAKTILDEVKGKGGLSTQDVRLGKPGYVQKKSELTTKLLKDIDGKAFVSKQYLLDATNRPELKQVEKDLIRDLLETEGDKIDVPAFTQKVEAELLPLKVKVHGGDMTKKNDRISTRYENISLPNELKGNVKNYGEHIYESPIKTSVANVHFPESTDGYFGHTRVEDMAPEWVVGNTSFQESEVVAKKFGDAKLQPKTRRVIEVQSDLYQKGRLENEVKADYNAATALTKADRDERIALAGKMSSLDLNSVEYKEMKKRFDSLTSAARKKKASDISKLQQYNNPTAHFRMVREEIKRAADDGVEKLQFPTGETGMKIEGLGESPTDKFIIGYGTGTTTTVKPDMLKVGMEILDNYQGDNWIVTDVLGDGKFKAVQKNILEMEGDYKNFTKGQWEAMNKSSAAESFDISGKVDENNPIYKFYEKELGKYLKNKYKAEVVTDKQGVQWWEVKVKPEHKGPVEAFGKARIDTILAGAAGTGALSAGVAGVKTLQDKSLDGKTFENKKLGTTILDRKSDAPAVKETYGNSKNPLNIGKGEKEKNEVIATVVAEAIGEGEEGMQYVLNNIMNRSTEKGKTMHQVVKSRNAYSAYGNPMFNKVVGLLNGTPVKFKDATEKMLIEKATKKIKAMIDSGEIEDLTGGSTHYWNPETAKHQKWMDEGEYTLKKGKHVFKKGIRYSVED